MSIIGIDASLTGTAVCVLDKQLQVLEMARFSSKPTDTLQGRLDRYTTLGDKVANIVFNAKPSVVLIEGYSFGSKGRAVVTMGEFGAMLRYWLLAVHKDLIEVPPSTVKLFAAGKGNAGKTEVVAALTKRYGVQFKSDDEYDAYALARMAACIGGWDSPENGNQRRALASLQSLSPQQSGG